MKYDYLRKNNWSGITRDERTFCMYLYNAFQDTPNEFANLLTSTKSPYKDFDNRLPVTGKHWEMAYEVCFYRDLLYAYGYKIKASAKQIKLETKINEPSKLIKRTFDLCLFSENEIIIIEAKAHEPFNKNQFEDFENDESNIKEIFKFLKVKNPPKVYFVVLASSKYYSSPSFTLAKGVAKEFLLTAKVADTLISWKQIADHHHFNKSHQFEKQLLHRANNLYNESLTFFK